MKTRALGLVLLGVCLGCGRVSRNQDEPAILSGDGGIRGSSGPGDAGVSAAGGAGSSGTPGVLTVQPTWRLTNVEFANTVRDLLGVAVTTSLDPDGAIAGYSAGQVAEDAAVEAYHDAAIQIAADAAPEVIQNVPCDPSQIVLDPKTCGAKFIDAFLPKAFRRPLDAATKAGLNDFFVSVSTRFGFAAGIQALLEEILQSPYFLYHLELEEQALGPVKVAVTGYSMAGRLSYLLWASLPDDQLFAAAASAQLSTPAQIEAQALRMLDDPKAKTGLRNFYEQWLSVRNLPTTKGDAFAATYTPALRASLLNSFRGQADDALWSDQGGLDTLLAGDQAYYDGNLSALMHAPNPGGELLHRMTLNHAERLGILLHPAVLAAVTPGIWSMPRARSEFIWDRILCQPLPDPPPDVPTFPGPTPNLSLREAYTQFDAPASCQTCHAQIDPVGFLFENYDTIGAYRTVDDSGQPVDSAASVVGVNDPALNGAVGSAVAFVQRLAGHSEQVSQCLATQLFRYAYKRREGDADRSFLAALATRYVQSGQSAKELLRALTQSEAFLDRLNEN
jgi:hypothetical protein